MPVSWERWRPVSQGFTDEDIARLLHCNVLEKGEGYEDVAGFVSGRDEIEARICSDAWRLLVSKGSEE